MRTNKAQGTIEYLVIIAIVIVIALVVVGLLLQIMGQNTGAIETSSKTAWRSAQPWAIKDWSQTGSTLSVVLTNNSSDAMDLSAIRINGVSTTAAAYRTRVPAGSDTNSISMTMGSCTTGSKYSYPKATIFIDYNSATISGKTQSGTADIVGTC